MTQTIREIFGYDVPSADVTAEGWLRTVRVSKGIAFLELFDGSCLAGLQAVVDEGVPDFNRIAALRAGSAVRVTGNLMESRPKDNEWSSR